MKIVKNTRPLLSTEELTAHFIQEGLHLKTEREIYFELHETGQIIATYHLSFDEATGISIDLLADYDNVEQLIKAHEITDVKELNGIMLGDIWLRYLHGDGYVCCDIDDINAELCFRIVKRITMVYSADLNFYQEIPKAMSMTQQFAKYIDANMHRFAVAAAMRPMLLPEELYIP